MESPAERSSVYGCAICIMLAWMLLDFFPPPLGRPLGFMAAVAGRKCRKPTERTTDQSMDGWMVVARRRPTYSSEICPPA